MFKKTFIEIIEDFINNIANGSFYYDRVFNMPGVQEKFELSQSLATNFLILAAILAIVAMLFNLDVFTGAKLKKIIRDIIISVLLISLTPMFIDWGHLFSNYFTEMWLPSANIGAENTITLLAAFGLSANPLTYKALGLAMLFLVILALIFITVLLISHSIAGNLLKILVIIMPIMFALYPIDKLKNYTIKINTLYAGILFLGPLQSLALSLASSALSETITFGGLIDSIGAMILVVLVVPGVLFYLIAVASNPKMLD